jgi:uncharacterized membrane-anchored protein
MIVLLNLGRALMVVWIAYALLLVFAPALLHRSPDPIGGAIQALTAFGLGYLLDRALSVVLRQKKALSEQSDPSERDGTQI